MFTNPVMLSEAAPQVNSFLCVQASESALAARFNGNWEQCLDRDDQGRIFLDFDPEPFSHILSYLRLRAVQSDLDARPPLPSIDVHQQAVYKGLIDDLVLMDFMGCADTLADLKFSPASPNFSLSPQRHIATFSNKGVNLSSIALEPAIETTSYMKLKIHKAQCWVFVGITTDVDDHQLHHEQRSSCGWACGHTYLGEGKCIALPRERNPNFLPGDTVLVKANLTCKNLSLKRFCSADSTTHSTHIRTHACAKEETKWRFYIELMCHGDQVELLPVSAEDQRSF